MTSYTARALSTDKLQFLIHQVAHGFVIGDVLRFNGATYVKAQANNQANAESVGMVSFLLGADDFVLTQAGYIINIANGSAPLTPGSMHFLDPVNPGEITPVQPVAVGEALVPLLVADTTTSGWYFNNSGDVIQSGTVFAWNEVLVDTTMAPNNGYYTNAGGSVNLTIPNTYSKNDIFYITAHSAGGFVILQTNAGTQVFDMALNTTAGAGGTTTSTVQGNTIELVALANNGALRVISSKGGFVYA